MVQRHSSKKTVRHTQRALPCFPVDCRSVLSCNTGRVAAPRSISAWIFIGRNRPWHVPSSSVLFLKLFYEFLVILAFSSVWCRSRFNSATFLMARSVSTMSCPRSVTNSLNCYKVIQWLSWLVSCNFCRIVWCFAVRMSPFTFFVLPLPSHACITYDVLTILWNK